MRITVKIIVEAPDARGHYPTALAWDHETIATDNPNFYGDAVQRAIRQAADQAVAGAEPYVKMQGV